jgi:hypothetical protein
MNRFLRALKSGWSAAVAVAGIVVGLGGPTMGLVPERIAKPIALASAAILAANDKLSPTHPDEK